MFVHRLEAMVEDGKSHTLYRLSYPGRVVVGKDQPHFTPQIRIREESFHRFEVESGDDAGIIRG